MPYKPCLASSWITSTEGFKLKYILERTKELSKERYPKAIISKNFEDILADEEVELIVVNTPNQLHAPMAKAALLAGKHVVVEKPFAISVAEGQELIDLSKSKNLSLNVYHNKRFEGEFKTVQELIKNRTVGDISLFETHFDRYRPDIGPKKWKEEGFTREWPDYITMDAGTKKRVDDQIRKAGFTF